MLVPSSLFHIGHVPDDRPFRWAGYEARKLVPADAIILAQQHMRINCEDGSVRWISVIFCYYNLESIQ